MKCPHCGMNIRDNVVICGYCGGTIAQPKESPVSVGGKGSASGMAQKSTKPANKKPAPPAEETDNEEEEGGLSAILEPGEQVLIGSLNIAVKKFTFHAYLTDRRIFLIDTQEKKLKVTAKDVPRETIVGSIVEFSENSDPVLVLSVKSVDDDVKTMKLVFTQSGVDRTSEIDDWISLLHEEQRPRKTRKSLPVEPAPEEEKSDGPVHAAPSSPRHELRPTRIPIKDHERQPPVKRLLTNYNVPESEEEPASEPESEPERPHHRQIRAVESPAKKYTEVVQSRENPPYGRVETQPVKKPEVYTAMKYAMKSPLQPVRRPQVYPVRAPVVEPVRPEPEPEPAEEIKHVARQASRSASLPVSQEEVAEGPQFCHNCGKKLPHSANFCPGCGTKLGQYRSSTTLPRAPHTTVPQEKISHEKKMHKPIDDDDEAYIPSKPPVKKAPKGSDMTILHKFLRR